ncbi:MAG: 23S rRNA (uridine(2552)-2'-O)-methyltransferase RlmE [Cardiobacterium sp.]
MARSKTSQRWLKEHFNDIYVQKAQQEGYRSRAVYKLMEIQEKDRLIRPGMVVVELGAAPGGWSQDVAQCLGGRGRIIALDILPMDALADVTFIQGDFREQAVLDALYAELGDSAVNLVISDMAPNTSGVRSVDQAKSMYLVELALDFAQSRLAPGGDFLTKIFHGPGFDTLLRSLKSQFLTVQTRKPEASRARSQETYLLARGFGRKS